MTKQELGTMVYELIVADIASKGANLSPEKFPKDYYISHREVFYIRSGTFKLSTLEKLPFVPPIRAEFFI